MPHRKRTLDKLCLEMIERGNEGQLTYVFEHNMLDIYAIDKTTKKPFHELITDDRFPKLAPVVKERVRLDEEKIAEEKRQLAEQAKQEEEKRALNERLKEKALTLNRGLNISIITPSSSLSKMYQLVLNCFKVKKR